MNCSQLLSRRTATNWERTVEPSADSVEHRETPETDSGRWSAVKFSSVGQTFSAWGPPSLKTSSN